MLFLGFIKALLPCTTYVTTRRWRSANFKQIKKNIYWNNIMLKNVMFVKSGHSDLQQHSNASLCSIRRRSGSFFVRSLHEATEVLLSEGVQSLVGAIARVCQEGLGVFLLLGEDQGRKNRESQREGLVTRRKKTKRKTRKKREWDGRDTRSGDERRCLNRHKANNHAAELLWP